MADPVWLTGAKLLAVLLLVLLNAFFVAAEFAIVKVRGTQVSLRLKEGDPRAKVAQHVTQHLDAYLSACQLGITMASLGLGWIGEPAVADLIAPAFAAAGLRDEVLLHATAFALAFGLITFLHIVFGELAPKSIAIRHAEDTTLRLSRPLHLFYRLFRPAIEALNRVANAFLHLAGFQPATSTEHATSESELREIIAGVGGGPGGPGGAGGARTTDRARRLLNIMDLGGLRVGEIMTPVGRVVFLDARKSLEENIRVADDSGYSRFPLMDGDPDHVLGMVHYKDIFSRVVRKDRPEQGLADIRREVLTAPETQRAEALLGDFIRRGLHMAVVVDEHGRTIGIVTMEDIFEEVFGSIRDEFDEAEAPPYTTLPDGAYLVDGTMHVRDLEQVLHRELRREGVSTVSGLVTDVLGRLPLPGETVTHRGLEFKVREVGRRRVRSVEVRAKA